jgi:succinate dehydrogenase / fumarate reductase cytochrome b subunit
MMPRRSAMLASAPSPPHRPRQIIRSFYPSFANPRSQRLATRPDRPRSPHLFSGPLAIHYRWSPAMTASIMHRVTGDGMATVGTVLLVWWLAAIAAGADAYATFLDVFTTASGRLNVLGWIVGVGLTWSLFQHMMSGIRHLVMDTGAAFELKLNRRLATLTFVASTLLTIAYWLFLGIK